MSTSSPFAQPMPPLPPAGKSSTAIIVIVLSVLLGITLLCGGVLVALLLPAVSAARQAARQMSSQNNMKQIGLALHNYHATYNTLPPAYSTDENGKPLLSWRVAILPFLEGSGLYDQFDLNQPWDSPANLALATTMPMSYQSPSYGTPGSDQTNYVAIRTPQSIFPGDNSIRFQELSDGIANTIAVVELPDKSVVWTRPDDSDPADLYAAFKNPGIRGVVVLFADGAVRMLPQSTPQTDLDALITRDGGEAVTLP